jgi:CheY-like chemotaxis protein
MTMTPELTEGRGEMVLVVEDDDTTRAALVDSLETLGYGTMEARDGQSALTTLEKHSDEIALVLSDAVMPKLSGTALLKASKSRGIAVPAVMVTGHPMKDDLESLRAQGLIVEWLSKPVDLKQLADVVAKALRAAEANPFRSAEQQTGT